ncbi:MAG: glycerophosphodiester phosphodiesterase, partial [Prevotellaceae bacterium]|nr:glycerophosphodiester phosphodiesterase [Prevotellaceae bacterium]
MKTKPTLLLALCLTASTVALPQQAKKIYPAIFDEQAHRGGRGLMPENTIPAMLNAIDLGVVTLELDLQISKDLKVVVSHEGFMSE